MPTTVLPPIPSGFAELHRVRMHTVKLITPLSQAELDFVPAPGRWSVGEIVDHIILAADVMQGNLEELIRLKRSGQRPFVKRTFTDFDVYVAFLPKSTMQSLEAPLSLVSRSIPETVRNFLLQNRILPFRAPKSATPRYGLPAMELINRLLASFEAVNLTFQNNVDLNFQEMLVQHPVFGHITMANLPDFIASHEVRHQKQVRKILRKTLGWNY